MIKQRVTVKECTDLFNSNKSPEYIRKCLYNLFENPDNFDTFCYFVLPNAFTHKFAPFHLEIFKDFNHDKSSAVAAPRGHGKSTLIGLGFILWSIAYKKFKYLVYTSENHTKSTAFLEPIRYELIANKMFKFLYGNANIKKVKDEELGGKDREDCFDYGDMRIQALSFEKNIRGLKFGNSRPDLIIFDDIENDDRVLNPDLRIKDWAKITKQIMPSLDPTTGRIKIIGTILNLDCALKKLLRLYDGKIYKAIHPDGSLLFPGLYTHELLNERKRTMGSSSFECEYMNNPVDNEASIIKREWMLACCDENLSFSDTIRKYDQKYQGVDFAFSDRVTADKSAFVGVGKVEGVYEVFQCILKKGLTITQQFDFINYLQGIVGYDDNALEENSIRSMSNELINYEFPYTLFWTSGSDAAKKEKYSREFDGKRHTIGKLAMINRLATQFENKRIRIPYKTERDKEIAHQIIDECSTYARSDGKLVEVGVHGDIPIALAYAIERAEMDKFEFDFGVVEM